MRFNSINECVEHFYQDYQSGNRIVFFDRLASQLISLPAGQSRAKLYETNHPEHMIVGVYNRKGFNENQFLGDCLTTAGECGKLLPVQRLVASKL